MSRLTLALALALATAACATDAGPRAEVHGLRLQRHGTGYPTVSGYVINQSDAAITSADVFVTLYDANNLPLDEVIFVTVQNVAPGDSARFRQRLDRPASGASLKYLAVN